MLFDTKKIVALVLCLFFASFQLTYAFNLRPIPWITHEAVCFLEDYMQTHPDAKILEFGSGASTIWFAKRTKNLVSVEHDTGWYNRISNIISNNPECNQAKLILHKRPYYSVCENFQDESFDLVLVDGRNRKGCIVNALRLIRHGGILMLDNAERSYYQAALELVQDWENVKSVQKGPDTCGFCYPNWQTHWYVKP